jgi:GMP synthase (glutamine-hydrolysing)
MKLLIVDFGSKYTHLIYHKLKYKLNCASKIIDHREFDPKVKDYSEYEWIILSGGPGSVEDFKIDWTVEKDLEYVNVLGICLGAQLLAKEQGYDFEHTFNEYGYTNAVFTYDEYKSKVWMSHQDSIILNPQKENKMDFICFDQDNDHPIAWSWKKSKKERCGLLFHPEVDQTIDGVIIFQEILDLNELIDYKDIDLLNTNIITQLKHELKNRVKENDHVFLAISGDIESSTLSIFLSQSLSANQVHFYLVDNGLMKKNEVKEVYDVLSQILPLNTLELIDASELFLTRLNGIENQEYKIKTIEHIFIDLFSQKIKKVLEANPLIEDGITYFAQATIWSDVIEYNKINQPIKFYNNIGGLHEKLPCTLLEPFRELYKDDIRMIAAHLALPDQIKNHNSFEWAGLAIKILGSVSKDKIRIIREVDLILTEYLKEKQFADNIWNKADVVLLPIKSINNNNQCDNRICEETIVIVMIDTDDGTNVKPSLVPIENLVEIGNQIQTRVKGVDRVVYNLSDTGAKHKNQTY